MISYEYELFTTKPCPECGESSVVKLPLNGYRAWRAGAYVQEAFPTMSAGDREMLITGTHPACWSAVFDVPCTECKKPIPEEDVVWAGGAFGEEFPWHVACCPPQYTDEEDDDVR